MNTNLPCSIISPDRKHLTGMQALWRKAFGDTEHFIHLFFDTAYSPNRCLIALHGDEIAGALYWFDCEYQGKRLAYLYAIATAKKYQKMGVCHSLMEECHQRLTGSGYAGVLLVPGNEGLYSFYRNMGYKICSYVRNFDCIAKKGDLSLRLLTKEQYRKLRRKFLPENGVIQDGENLDFLENYAEFYAGCDCEDADPTFLLTAYMEGNTLHGVELLGNLFYASHIVHTLGCSKGIFRTPILSCTPESFSTQEEHSPFAMYHPLGNDRIDLPVYFGLAFD